MFKFYTHYRNLLCAYPHLYDAVANHGRNAYPRGKLVQEFRCPILWHIDKPQEYLLAIPGRRLNPFFALAEVVWMWSGKGGLEFISFYNSQMKKYSDPGVPYLHGAYGKRVRHAGYSEAPFRESLPQLVNPMLLGRDNAKVEVDQLDFVVNKLRTDPDTRQAVVSIWDVVKDNFVKSNDYPCNNMLYFTNRGGALDVSVVVRSNDLIWGTPYNMCQFSHLQALMAGTLDLEVGSFHVMVNNLHYYLDLYTDALSSVSGWYTSVCKREIDLDGFSDTLFPAWDMRWTIDGLDTFVSQTWDYFEKESRQMIEFWAGADGAEPDPYYSSKLDYLDNKMEDAGVPAYWKHLFHVLFMWHCRKAGAPDTYSHLLVSLPAVLRWAIEDFTGTK